MIIDNLGKGSQIPYVDTLTLEDGTVVKKTEDGILVCPPKRFERHIPKDQYLYSDYNRKRISVGKLIEAIEKLRDFLNEIDLENPIAGSLSRDQLETFLSKDHEET